METNSGCDLKLIFFSGYDNNQGPGRFFEVQHVQQRENEEKSLNEIGLRIWLPLIPSFFSCVFICLLIQPILTEHVLHAQLC